MSIESKLPEKLRYLEPVRKELGKIPSEELDEMTDTDLLVEVLQKKTNRLSDEQADALLTEHTQLLAQWLEDKSDSEAPCHFMYGFLMGTSAEALRSEATAEPEMGFAHARFPDEFKLKRKNVSLNAKKGNLLIAIIPCPKDTYNHLKHDFTTPAPKINSPGSVKVAFDQEFSTIESDNVCGYKKRMIIKKPKFFKQSDYLLTVPGGFAHVTIASMGKDFDEAPIEPFLQTIEIKSKP